MQASDYTAALRLVSLPAGQIVILEENGSQVLAAGYQGKLYHSHIFAPAATLSAEELAQEIVLARISLEAELGEGLFTGISLVGQPWDQKLMEILHDLTGMTVRPLAQLPPNSDLDTHSWPRLLPAVVRESQQSAVRRAKITRWPSPTCGSRKIMPRSSRRAWMKPLRLLLWCARRRTCGSLSLPPSNRSATRWCC
jgi:hypothetical protein